jgi:hypothetical protein
MKTKKTKMRKFTEMLYWLSEGNAGSGILFSIHPANAESLKLGTEPSLKRGVENSFPSSACHILEVAYRDRSRGGHVSGD